MFGQHRIRSVRRGRTRGLRAVKGIVVPVLEDAMDRSLRLAAAMDSRGYGRRAYLSAGVRAVIASCVLFGLVGVCVGVYGVLDGTSTWLGVPLLAAGLAVAVVGFVLGGKRVRRTAYRPDPWRWPETAVVLAGVGACVLLVVTSRVDPENLYPSLSPLRWPEVSLVHALSLLVAVLPAFVAPPPPLLSEVVR